MKGTLLVADSARRHPDGTFSLLRGGIDRLEMAPGQPIVHRGSVVVRLHGDETDAGKHEFVLKVEAKNGEKIAPDLAGAFEIPKTGGGAVVAFDFGFQIPGPGPYRFVLLSDGKELDSWRVDVVTASASMLLGGKK